MHTDIHAYVYMHMCAYIYIYRERERYTYIYMYTYYIHAHRYNSVHKDISSVRGGTPRSIGIFPEVPTRRFLLSRLLVCGLTV